MQLDLGIEITRSRIVSVDPETGKRGGSKLDGPAGCFTCQMVSEGGRWTRRAPHATVYKVQSLLYCEEHVDGAIRQAQRRTDG